MTPRSSRCSWLSAHWPVIFVFELAGKCRGPYEFAKRSKTTLKNTCQFVFLLVEDRTGKPGTSRSRSPGSLQLSSRQQAEERSPSFDMPAPISSRKLRAPRGHAAGGGGVGRPMLGEEIRRR